jgi:hypothetical protein
VNALDVARSRTARASVAKRDDAPRLSKDELVVGLRTALRGSAEFYAHALALAAIDE